MSEKHDKCPDLVRVEESVKSAHRRIDEVKENQKILLGMNANLERLVEQNKHQNEKIENIEKDVTTLKEKPGKRYDLIVTGLISTIVGALATAMMAGLFN